MPAEQLRTLATCGFVERRESVLLCGPVGVGKMVLAALHERSATRVGRFVDCSLLDSMMGLLTYLAGGYFMTGEEPGPVGSGHHSLVPYGAFAASDGYVVIATLTNPFWRKLCTAIGREDLAADPAFDTAAKRRARRDEVDRIVGAVIPTRTVAEWQEHLESMDVPHAPILSLGQVLQHPQVVAREMVQEVEHPALGRIPVIGRPLHFSGSAPSPITPSPLLGEHTRSVLEDVLHYSSRDVDSLIQDRVVVDAEAVPRQSPHP